MSKNMSVEENSVAFVVTHGMSWVGLGFKSECGGGGGVASHFTYLPLPTFVAVVHLSDHLLVEAIVFGFFSKSYTTVLVY